jgi:hypothetical protein
MNVYKLTSAFLASLVLLSGAALAVAQGKGDVTIDASANPTLFKAPMTLSGRVKAEKDGVTVVLQRRASQTGTFADVTSVATTGNGDYTFALAPRRNGYFRAVAKTTPEVTSDELLVAVAPKVGMTAGRTTVAPNSRVRLRGKVRPKHNGSRIQIQLRDAAGAWTTVKTPRLRNTDRSYSRYRTRVRVPATGTYRAFLPGHADHADGVSGEVTITAG